MEQRPAECLRGESPVPSRSSRAVSDRLKKREFLISEDYVCRTERRNWEKGGADLLHMTVSSGIAPLVCQSLPIHVNPRFYDTYSHRTFAAAA